MAETRQVVVETVQVTKIFRDFWMRPKAKALDNVDLQVSRGEVFGLLGPNGSGKSTLVKILLGLLFPTSGRAAVFGRDPRNIAVKDRIGYMPEESYLYRYLNAEETLNFYGRLFNLPRRERRHRTDLLLDMVGLERQRKRPIVEYSKGMARRIGLAQALINDPDLVFLDEPTTGLDPIGTRSIKDLISELKERGKTVFLCSHLLADVEDVCDRVAILYGGKVQRLGNVDDLLTVKAQTQITTEQLSAETINKLTSLIREMEGSHKELKVTSPRDRLESFFLRVVEEARAANIETAGTTVGSSAGVFFAGIEREEKADSILDELLAHQEELAPDAEKESAAGQRAQQEAVVIPASPPETDKSKEIIGDLLATAGSATTPADAEDAETGRTDTAAVLPAGGPSEQGPTTEDVLRGLLGSEKEQKGLDDDKESASGQLEK